MTMLIIGLVLFFIPHSVAIVAPHWRERMKLHMGDRSWKSLYGVLSLIGFVLIVVGFGHARQAPIVLWVSPAWLRHVTFLLMVPVFPLIFAAYLPGRIQAKMKHPMLAAIKLWAAAHLLVNGTLADVVLFGSFLVWAVIDRVSLKSRLPARVSALSPSRLNDVIAVILGVIVYLLFVFKLHELLIGRSLLPSS